LCKLALRPKNMNDPKVFCIKTLIFAIFNKFFDFQRIRELFQNVVV
jgi:hypothetical protein